jgi:hypothetical protein
VLTWKSRLIALGVIVWILVGAFTNPELTCLLCATAVLIATVWEEVERWRAFLKLKQALK